MSKCIFCKIISEEAPGDVLYKDKEIIVFKDVKPASKYHYLSVPIKHIDNVNSLTSSKHYDLCKIFVDFVYTIYIVYF